MRKLPVASMIGVALFGTAHAGPYLMTVFENDPVMPWVLAAIAWLAFWSGVLALVWGPKRSAKLTAR